MVFYAASSSAFFRFLFGSVSWVIVSMFLFVWGVHFVYAFVFFRFSGVIVSMALCVCGCIFFRLEVKL